MIGRELFAASIFPIVAVGLDWKGATSEGAARALVGMLFTQDDHRVPEDVAIVMER